MDRRVVPLGRLRAGTSNPVRSETSFGGTARNIAEALARLGHQVAFFSRVGPDDGGRHLLRELSELGVDVGATDVDASRATASYNAVHDEAGELALGLADMDVLDSLDAAWLDARLEALATHELWIADANLPTELAKRLAEAKPEGTSLYVDPVSVEKSSRWATALGRLDAIFPDLAEARALAGRDGSPGELAAALRSSGCDRVVLTLGAEGVQLDTAKRREKLAPMTPRSVVSVNGAGDALVAGFVHGELIGADPVACGLAAASLSVESSKAVPESLRRDTIRQRCDA